MTMGIQAAPFKRARIADDEHAAKHTLPHPGHTNGIQRKSPLSIVQQTEAAGREMELDDE